MAANEPRRALRRDQSLELTVLVVLYLLQVLNAEMLRRAIGCIPSPWGGCIDNQMAIDSTQRSDRRQLTAVEEPLRLVFVMGLLQISHRDLKAKGSRLLEPVLPTALQTKATPQRGFMLGERQQGLQLLT